MILISGINFNFVGRGPAFSVLETIYEVDDEDDDEDDDDDELEEEEVSREWGHTMYQSTPAYDDSVDDDQVYDADSIYDGTYSKMHYFISLN